ncbi:hypothetical protein PRZ48_006841 [Zasmidium cellare]|uniref:Phasin domain-containing protein n=1 Tax=Zasmidium cellare TaxID=395010 RepID=A0ABR0EHQ9_ZASCE|nr:hypothetical protein PRZ48_006841 [Zasmidium cellare]
MNAFTLDAPADDFTSRCVRLADFSESVSLKAQAWADDAIAIVNNVIDAANKEAATRGAQALTQTASLFAKMQPFEDEILNMVVPGLNQILLPWTPGSGTRPRDLLGSSK